MYVSVTFTAFVPLIVRQVVLVIEYVLFVLPGKFEHYLEPEVAGDTLQRKVSFLDLSSGVSGHVVGVVPYATPKFVRRLSGHKFFRINAASLFSKA